MPDLVSPLTPKTARNELDENDKLSPLSTRSTVRHKQSHASYITPPGYGDVIVEDYGKETVPFSEEKQVIDEGGLERDLHAEEKQIASPEAEKETVATEKASEKPHRRKKSCFGMSLRAAILMALVLLALVVAIAVALPLTIGRKKDHPLDVMVETTAPQTVLSGIDFDEPFDDPVLNPDSLADIFFQRSDGVIRQLTMLNNGSYLTAALNDDVATNAQRGTPIAVTSFIVSASDKVKRTNRITGTTARQFPGRNSCTENCISQRHIFYTDKKGVLQERRYDNVTRRWQDGSIGSLEIKPVSNPGLKVCTGNDFVGQNASSSYRDGLSVFYGSSETTVTQLGWNYGDKSWLKEQVFVDVNPRGGIACSIRPDSTSVVTQNGTNIQFWWRDSNFSQPGNTSHPVGIWAQARTTIPGIHHNASLDLRSYRNPGHSRTTRNRYLVTQMEDLSIRAFNLSGKFENIELANINYGDVSVPWIEVKAKGARPLSGTRIAFTADPGPQGRNTTSRTWITWFQTREGSILQSQASDDNFERWQTEDVLIGD